MLEKKEYSIEVGGKQLTVEFNDLADQANGSVLVRYGDTAVLVTVVMSQHAQDGMSYFPLSVEYEERFYAAGQILGSRFMRREGKPSDEAVLTGRAIDRTMRPLFNQAMRNSVQIVITVLSIGEDDPDVLAINAASLALATSDIPWGGPVSAVRVGKKKDSEEMTLNPEYEFRNHGEEEIDLLACGKDGLINMIEVGSHEASEADLSKALELASSEIEKLQEFQNKIVAEVGREKREVKLPEISDEIKKSFTEQVEPKLEAAVFAGPGKAATYELMDEWFDHLAEALPDEDKHMAKEHFEEVVDELLHKEALANDRRADGRGMDDVREIRVQAGNVAKMIHGTGVFFRGGTHILSALTLGSPNDSQIIDGMEIQEKKGYIHHYNFPPFSVGETGRVGGFNRRAVGHGALAEKALLPVLPKTIDFPYTIRIVSEVLASNGSSSMGSVCGSTLALMDAGVPITRPVAGIAMGLILGETPDQYKILTDIQGPEDHHGDMDFKVAGTREGVTAVQMDVKVNGIPVNILSEAFEKAKAARLFILDHIEKEIPEPRAELPANAPRILVHTIDPEQIGLVIGSGGKTINGIKDQTGAEIDIEEDGTIFVTGEAAGAEEALETIKALTKKWEACEQADGVVARIVDFGAFVTIGPDTDGLVHISEIAPFRLNRVEDVLKEGEEVPVVVKEVDERGRISLSIKQRDPEFASRKGVKPAQPRDGGPHHTNNRQGRERK